ncbi:MAG: hypothetical protein GY854_28865 [Deltaproteobacteria bacterium]|nr:hypothetical protein [Deltaproteobacteria bacterium]
MKRSILMTIFAATLFLANPALAERLELGFALTPTVMQDVGYEAFSSSDLRALRLGIDIRSEVASLGGFKIIPLIGYRAAFDSGSPYNVIDTDLALHDLYGGLRVRKGITSWFGAFLEFSGGILFADLGGAQSEEDAFEYGDLGARQSYDDLKYTWSAAGLAGLEFQLPKSWLRSRGVKWVGFGAELAGGYVRRGDIEFEPSIESGGDNAMDAETRPWGQVNLSGWMIQVAASFRFF